MFLGLTVEEFMDLTPRMFSLVWKQYRESEDRLSQRFNVLGFRLFQAMGVKKEGGKSFTPEDLGVVMPKTKKSKGTSAQRMWDQAMEITLRGEYEKSRLGKVVKE